MQIAWKIVPSVLFIASFNAAFAQTRADNATPAGRSLQQQYDSAQRLQIEAKPEQAQAEYRSFLADALGTLGIGFAHAGDSAQANGFFDEALSLVPNSPSLRLEYARTALMSGDLPRAEKLTRGFLDDYPNSKSLAEVHRILGRTLLKMNRDEEARKEFETAVKLDSSFANGYDLAIACLDLDDEKCAAQIFGEIQASFGDTAAIHMTFGRAYGDSDFTPRAIEEFRKAISENSRLPGAHYCLAAALLAAGGEEARSQEVELELKKELEISPNDFLTYAALGNLAAVRQNYPEAEQYLKHAIALNPRNPDAFLYLGKLYFDTDRPSDAEPVLLKAIQLTTDVSRNRYQIQKAHFLLGRILMREHQEQKAHIEMQIAHSLADNTLSQDRKKLAGLLSIAPQNGDAENPLKDSETTTIANPKDADPGAIGTVNALAKQLAPAMADSYNNIGAIAASGKDYEQALKYFASAAKWNPSLEGLDLNWGRAAFMASKFSEAITPLSRYVRSHPDDPGIRGALGMSQFMTADYKGCVDTLKTAQDQISNIPQMRYVYAESLLKTGEVASGTAQLESLEAAHPEIAEVHRGLGESFALRGDWPAATRELTAAVSLNEGDPESHFELGRIELEGGKVPEAISDLETAIRLRPGDPKFHRELAGAYRKALRPAEAEKERNLYESLVSHGQSARATGDSSEPKAP